MKAHSTPAAEATRTHVSRLSFLTEWVGKELGVSSWMQITQDRINTFAQASEDHQWIHIDPERAAQESPFSSTIVQGFLLLALLPRICYQTLLVDNVTMALNYGLDSVRFFTPVPVDSEIRGRVALESFEMRGRKARLKLGVTFEMKDKSRPVCRAELLSQVLVNG